MRHARPDYNRIQDPESKIPADEPVFLLRAQDVTAPEVVRFWAERARQVGADESITDLADNWSFIMHEWQREHGVKVPDIPKA